MILLPEKVGESKKVQSFLKRLIDSIEQERTSICLFTDGVLEITTKFVFMEIDFSSFIEGNIQQGRFNVKKLKFLLGNNKSIDMQTLFIQSFEKDENIKRKKIQFFKNEETNSDLFIGVVKFSPKPYQVVLFEERALIDYNNGDIISEYDSIFSFSKNSLTIFTVPKFLSKMTSADSFLIRFSKTIDKKEDDTSLIEMSFSNEISSTLRFGFKVRFLNLKSLSALGA